ncbi:hypothetical protein [Planctomicrobium piriforme]|uniref:Uncharacterized protein n=1 Tax=Planctomicrobium piriforme TaxID=1576369 RepID=A0A1I3ASU5_9PLAN|nr:hypothetical protein [Planctomicrobium piriforme]SFH53135.1 hypothetical protein SAMN05421753_10141 [Planctomicrobium piriforme]
MVSVRGIFFGLVAVGLMTGQGVADEPLPSAETLFREAFEHVKRIDSLEFESVTEFKSSKGEARALQRSRLYFGDHQFRMDLMSNGAAVRDNRFDEILFFNQHGCCCVQPGGSVSLDFRPEEQWRYNHDLWRGPYRWLNTEPSKASLATRLRSIADRVEKGELDPRQGIRAASIYPAHWYSFGIWEHWNTQLPPARVAREVEHFGRRAFVVELNVDQKVPLEVWFIRDPACIPVLIAGPDKQQDRTVSFDVLEFEVVQTQGSIIIIPTLAAIGAGETERLIPETLKVNQPIDTDLISLPPIRMGKIIDQKTESMLGDGGALKEKSF